MSDDDHQAAVTSLRRAFDEAFARPPTPPSSASAGTLLVVHAGGRRVALPLTEVAEVVGCPPLTRVPSASAELLGLAGVRGAIVAVFHLAHIVGAAEPESVALPPRWVAVLAADRGVALAFDELEGQLPAPPAGAGPPAGLLRVAEVGGASCVVVDPAAFVARDGPQRSS